MRFFVSYTGADQAWAEWLAWQLEAAGHQAVLQAWDFRPGENFVVNMRRALDSADRTLAVVSAAYLESVYGSDEWTAAFVQDHPETMNLLVILVQDVTLPRLLRPWVHINLVGLDAEVAAQRLLDGVARGRRKPDQAPAFPPAVAKAGGPSFPSTGPAIWNLPYRNSAFTGRDDLLARLRAHLGGSAGGAAPVAVVTQALYGLGGVGKTQLALEYAHRYAADYDLAWWIPSENPLGIPAELARLAPKLGIAVTADQEEVVAGVLDALRGRERWLLVFDYAEQPQDLARWLPAGRGGHVLVTSRNPAWGTLGQAVRVDLLPRAQAIALLLRRTPDQDPIGAQELAAELGDLPLALEQAAAYLEQTGMPLGAYLTAYRCHRERLLAKGRAVAYQGQVDTTWQLSIDRITQTSTAGVELLRLCAFLAPEAIPLNLFTANTEVLPEALAAAVAEDGDAGTHEAAGACYRYSLVDRDQTGIRVHRLVQQVVRAQLTEEDRQAAMTTVMELLASAFPTGINELADPTRWPRCGQLLAHVMAAAGHAEEAGIAKATTAVLLRRAGIYLERRGDYVGARSLLEQALPIARAGLGPGHIEVAQVLGILGWSLRGQGDLAGARAHLELGLTIAKAAVGPNHPDVASGYCTLGAVLRDQGDLAGARAHLERALTISEAALVPDHFWMGVVDRNLGDVLRDQGDLAGARAHLERAVTVSEAAVGPHHPAVAYALSTLGDVLRDQGDLAGARAHLERALTVIEAAVGPHHPDVAYALSTLGLVLRDQGDLAGARARLERALTIFEAALGPDHHEVGNTLGTLGLVLRDQGDLAGARARLERALTIKQAALGPDHREVGISRWWLGEVLQGQGDRTAARMHLERAHTILEVALGLSHPHTQAVARRLAR